MNKRLIRTAIACSVALIASAFAQAESIRYYDAGEVPDPRVVARILGAKPAQFAKLPKTRGLFSSFDDPAPGKEAPMPEVKDGGRTVTEDDIAASASAAVSAWNEKFGRAAPRSDYGGGMRKVAYAAPSSVESSEEAVQPVRKPAAKQRVAAEPAKASASGKADALALAITFANNSAELNPQAAKAIDAVAEGIKIAGFDKRFIVEGHTSAAGSVARNIKLSRMRAEAVKRYLIARHGIPEQVLIAKGFGSSVPLARANPMGAENRRVQFRAATA